MKKPGKFDAIASWLLVALMVIGFFWLFGVTVVDGYKCWDRGGAYVRTAVWYACVERK